MWQVGFLFGIITSQMRIFFKLFAVSLFSFIFLTFNQSLAEEVNQNAAKERREELQKELDIKESEIKAIDLELQQLKTKKASLGRDIAIFDAEIKKAKLQIQRLDAEIAKTKTGIVQRTDKIKTLSDKSEKKKDSLAELIRKNNEMDSTGLAEIVLGYQKMSDFFVAEDTLEPIHRLIQDTLDEIRSTKKQTEREKNDLTEYKDEQLQLKEAQERERKKLTVKQIEKTNLLKITNGVEKGYQTVMALKQKEAAKIRSALFALRDTAEIPFGKALEYASFVLSKTGVRPAFLLAIFQQESNLGENVGRCNRPQDTKKWRDIMPGPDEYKVYLKNGKSCKNAKIACSSRDDQTAFINVMASLGRDTDNVPLSCPITSVGPWGGAMGPAQFIPTTWNGIKSQVAKLLSKKVADPWEAQDAFMASAIYLSDLGSINGNYGAEIKAACRYFGSGGSSCYYGKQVMARAQDIQENMIDKLNL